MKLSISIVSFIFVVIFSFPVYSQSSGPSKDDFLNKELNVTKLIINDKDLSENLAKVIVTNDQWIEYDHKGNIIGVAKMLKLTDESIKIKWTQADNGASVGDVTLSGLSRKGDVLNFSIQFDGKNQGYLEVRL